MKKQLLYLVAIFILLPAFSRAQVGFKVSGTDLLDNCGNKFVMRGINVPLVWYISETHNNIANIRNVTGANTLRLVIGNGYQPNDGPGSNWSISDADWQQAVQLTIDNNMIPMVEVHNVLGSNDPNDLQAVANWWASKAPYLTQPGIEEYVLINIANEWGSWFMASTTNAPSPSVWRDAYINAVQTIRAAGIKTTLVVDAPNFGQDIEAGTILNYALDILNNDPENNVLFSLHMYCEWSTCGASQPNNHLLQIQNAGIPIMVGEFGPEHNCGCTIDEDLILNTTANNDIGWIAWSWTANGGGVSFLDMSNNWDGTGLTTWGQTVINHTYGTGSSSYAAAFDGCLPGCTSPDLGTDRSLCGTSGTITLNSGLPADGDRTFEWRNSSGTLTGPNSTENTYDVSAAGTYTVIVDSSGCISSDSIIVSASIVPNLGPDVNLCSPASITLNPGTDPGFSYTWEYNGTVISLYEDSSKMSLVSKPGTYEVFVDATGCSATSDQITITSDNPTPDHDTICVSSGDDVANLAVTGFTNPPDWYDAATGGNLVQSGSGTFTTPPLTGTTTYYVESNDGFKSSIGPETPIDIIDPAVDNDRFIDGSTNEGYGSTTCSGNFIEFTVTNDVTLDSVTVYGAYINSTDPVIYTIDIFDVSSGCPGTSITGGTGVSNSMTNPYLGMGDNTNIDKPFQLYVGLTLTAGNTYRMILTGGNSQMIRVRSLATDVNVAQANYEITGVVDITARGETWTQTMWPGFFDIIFSSGSQCDRVPVTAYDGGSCPTPVDWLHFSAMHVNEGVQLSWGTASEQNNDYFVIERSGDGEAFKAIGRIEGHGTTSIVNAYGFVDDDPLTGTSYYRIRQVDFDSSQSYTGIRSVYRDDGYHVDMFPNPFTNQVQLLVNGNNEEPVTLRILDTKGRVLIHLQHVTNETITLGESLAAGVYFLQVTGAQASKTLKLIKR